jgi:hypothetical protein
MTSGVGRNLSAEAGTRSTPFRLATSIVRLAVIPGFNFSSGLGALTIAV